MSGDEWGPYQVSDNEIRELIVALFEGRATAAQQSTAADVINALLLEREAQAEKRKPGVDRSLRNARIVSIAIALVRYAGASVNDALLAADPTVSPRGLPALRRAYYRAKGRATLSIPSAELQAARARLNPRARRRV